MHKIAKRDGRFYVIGPNSHPLACAYETREEAEDRLDSIRRAAQRSTRTCMTCQRSFESEGSHNRMCRDCKRLSTA